MNCTFHLLMCILGHCLNLVVVLFHKSKIVTWDAKHTCMKPDWQLDSIDSWDWVEKWSRSSQTATPAPLLAFCTKPKCQNLHRDLDILNSRLSSLGFFSQILWKGLLPIACGIFWRTSSKSKCQVSDQLLCLCWNLPQLALSDKTQMTVSNLSNISSNFSC